MNDNIVLSVRDLEVNFYNNERCNRVLKGRVLSAAERENHVHQGESGCGKSVTANSIMGLLPDLSRIENGGYISSTTAGYTDRPAETQG